MKAIHNIAIIAHVDHGKTTLLDEILKFCSSVSEKETRDRIMDSSDLERERGITITSKNTAVLFKDHQVNVVDTPGHSDFGGEVERVLRMVDSCLLLVDAREGPMPQTRFVLKKAMEMGHKIILVINKVDMPERRIDEVIDQTLELFIELDATDDQIDFPIIYTSAKAGYAVKEQDEIPLDGNTDGLDMGVLLDAILEHGTPAGGSSDNALRFQVTTLDYNEYIGRICIGRIFDGQMKIGDEVVLVGVDKDHNQVTSKHNITKLFRFHGLARTETDSASAGDIVAIAGIDEMTIGDTLCSPDSIEPLPRIEIEPPTVAMQFQVNDSPFAGKSGSYLTSRQLRDRLDRELKTNLSLRVEDQGDSFNVCGRGELHLAVLIESMRREGFELSVCKPEVIFKTIDSQRCEPYEEVLIDMPEEYSGSIIQELNRKKGMMVHMENISDTFVRVKYEMPTRGLIGFRSFFLTETRGHGTMSSLFLGYRPFAGPFTGRKRGAMVSMTDGKSNPYALFNLQERGDMFIGPQIDVYEGMVIGLHNKDDDLEVNPVKEKKLTNVRASGSDEALRLVPPRKLSLEDALDLLEEDEMLEVTPDLLRLRKKVRQASMRKKDKRRNA